MTIKDAIYREIAYGLCGTGGALNGIVSVTNVISDERLDSNAMKAEENYPLILLNRINEPEDNLVRLARPRMEIEIVGLRASATKGDEILDQVNHVLRDHFGGKHKTIGKFLANGTPDPSGGLKVHGYYIDTVEPPTDDMDEKSQIMMFSLGHLRA